MLRYSVRLLRSSLPQRCAACLSDGPSTSRVGVAHPEEMFGPDDEAAPEARTRKDNTSEKSTTRAAEKRKDHHDQMSDTKNRIRRWKNRTQANTTEDLQQDESGPRRLSDSELRSRIDNEERDWNDRAAEIVRILGDMSPVNPDATARAPQMSPDEIELKRKTGKVKFRSIIYDEGELDKSDLTLPPSRDNPHPFDPSKSGPPVLARSIAPFVNHMPLLQALVDLGVNLFEIDSSTHLSRQLVRLDIEKDVKPKLQWLVSIGLEPAELGDYLTRNPFFLIQNLDDMMTRVNYLESKKFSSDDIVKIVTEFRYWLNMDVKTMDARLGWIQKQFKLSGNDVRRLVIKEPRIVMFGLGPLQRLVKLFSIELPFTVDQMKKMLLEDPRLFMMDAKYITNNYYFVSRVMGISNKLIVEHPFLLRCSISTLKNRHFFLRKMGRAHYEIRAPSPEDQSKPADGDGPETELVSMDDLLSPSDAIFATRAAKTYLVMYDKFLRSN